MFLSVIFLLKKRNFLSFLSFELLWERLPKHTPVLRRFLLIDFQWLDFKKLMQFCPTAEGWGAHTVGSALHLSLVTIRTFSCCCHLPSSKRGKNRIFWFPLIWASLKSHWKFYHRLWEQQRRCPMQGPGGNLGTTYSFYQLDQNRSSIGNNCLSHPSETKYHSGMGSLSNRDLLSNGSRGETRQRSAW